MEFLTEPPPARGALLPARPGIGRVVADNPGPMTYHGTNTWLIETPAGLLVLDPGPDDDAHTRSVLAAASAPIALILLSHAHHDHSGGLERLREATGAPVAAFAIDGADRHLTDGDTVAGLTAFHTPGHAADHLCFAGTDADGTPVLFSGDHVMGWSTSVVSPPDGDMGAYLASLRRLTGEGEAIYLPGHGPAIPAAQAFVSRLIEHRVLREASLLAALRDGPADLDRLTRRLYPELDRALLGAAARTVLAHLLKLAAEGHAREEGRVWVAPA